MQSYYADRYYIISKITLNYISVKEYILVSNKLHHNYHSPPSF